MSSSEHMRDQTSENTPQPSKKTEVFKAPDDNAKTRKRKSGWIKRGERVKMKRKRGSKCALEMVFQNTITQLIFCLHISAQTLRFSFGLST